MGSIYGIKFREYGQIYYFEKGDFEVAIGDKVIVKTDQGQGLGEIVSERDDLPEDAETDELKPLHRHAADEDFERAQENDVLAREAHKYCVECIRSRDLDMKLVDVEVYFDRSKIVFYFTAPARIDFRELVKDLVKNYRTRIELRQIGVRHETQMVGAVGNCGMVCCCRQFLRTFAPVTIKMAKEQNLFLNPAKISGICGRLLCCLSYEQENYEEFYRACPKLGKKYQTGDGPVKVLRANMFRNSIAVLTEQNEEKEIPLEDWEQMNPSRPDQAKQDAARAAAKRAVRDNEGDSEIPQTDDETDGGAESGLAPERKGKGNSARVDEPEMIQQTEFGPEDVSMDATSQAPGQSASSAATNPREEELSRDGSVSVGAEAVSAVSEVVPHIGEAGNESKPFVPSDGSVTISASTEVSPLVAETPDRVVSSEPAPEAAKPAKDSRVAPLRKPVKSADPGSRRTSRGRRKRKRKSPGSSDE